MKTEKIVSKNNFYRHVIVSYRYNNYLYPIKLTNPFKPNHYLNLGFLNKCAKMLFTDLKKHSLISEKDIGSTVFRIYENRIYHVEIKKGEKVTMEVINEGYLFLEENGGGTFYNVFEFKSFADVDPNVREWSASPLNNSYTIIDAIVISSLSQRILADFYVRYNKPVRPTRVFTSIEKAYEWVKNEMKQKHLV